MQYGIYKPCTCFCEHFYFMIFFYSISSRFSIQFSESKNHADVKTAETITMIDWVIDSQRRTHRNLMGLHHHAWRHRLRERHCFAVFYYESSPVQENNAGRQLSLGRFEACCKVLKVNRRVQPALMSQTVKLRGWTASRTWAPMSPRTAESQPTSGRK